jgi:hypothetical protein
MRKEESKKLSLPVPSAAVLPQPAGPDVFCLFFSKKKRFSNYLFPVFS